MSFRTLKNLQAPWEEYQMRLEHTLQMCIEMCKW